MSFAKLVTAMNDLTFDNLAREVNRRAYFMQYGIHMTPREAVQADFRAAGYKRQYPGRNIFQARRYAVDVILRERGKAA